MRPIAPHATAPIRTSLPSRSVVALAYTGFADAVRLAVAAVQPVRIAHPPPTAAIVVPALMAPVVSESSDTAAIALGQIQALAVNLQATLDLMETALESKAFAETLPLVGNQLGTAFSQGQAALAEFKSLDSHLISALQTIENAGVPTAVSVVQTALNAAIVAAGWSGTVSTALDGNGNLTVNLADTVAPGGFSVPLGASFGIPGLNFQTQGNAHAALTWGVNLSATVAQNGAVSISAPSGAVTMGLTVTAPTFTGDADLGPLRVTAADHGSVLSANVTIDTHGTASLSGSATADVNLATDLGSAALPSISTELKVAWPFGTGNVLDPSNEATLGQTPTVTLQNVSLGMGTFVTNLVKPVLDDLESVITPIQPIITLLTTPITPVMALPSAVWKLLDHNNDNTVSLLDFINGGTDASLNKAVALIQEVNSLDAAFQNVSLGAAQWNLGTFSLPTASYDIRQNGFDISTAVPLASGAETLSQFLGAVGGGATLQSDLTQLLTPTSSDQGGFNFPILDDPASAASVLFGGTADLVTYQLPETLFGNGTIDQFGNITGATPAVQIPIFTGVNLDIIATLAGRFGLAFGYDTSGLTAFAQGGYSNPALILNGLYVANPTLNGQQVPAVTFGGEVGLGIDAGVAGTSVGGTGDVSGVINLGFANNGTEYLGSLLSLLNTNPLALFSVDGRITAGLDFNVDVLDQTVFSVSSPRVVLYPPANQTGAANGVPTATVWTPAGPSNDFETADNWTIPFASHTYGLGAGTWDVYADATIDPDAAGFSRPVGMQYWEADFAGPLVADLYSLKLASDAHLYVTSGTLGIDGTSIASAIAGELHVGSQPGALLGGNLVLSGIVNNTGTIIVDPTAAGTAAPSLGFAGVTDLTGGGLVYLNNPSAILQLATLPTVHVGSLLRNDDNTIYGSGIIDVAFENHGAVDASNAQALVIDTSFSNTGLLEAAPAPNAPFGKGGTLELESGLLSGGNAVTIDNTGGTISAASGGQVFLGAANVSGPSTVLTVFGGALAVRQISGAADGSITVRNAVTLDGGTLGMSVGALVGMAGYSAGASALTLHGVLAMATYGSAPGADGFAASGNMIYLYGADLRGGLLDGRQVAGNGGALVESSATLDGSAGAAGVGLAGTLTVGAGHTLALVGGIVPARGGGAIDLGAGTLVIGAGGNDSAVLGAAIAGDSGVGTIELDNIGGTITGSDASAMLTNAWLITGGALISTGFANQASGTIEAASSLLLIDSGAVASSNAGLIVARPLTLMTMDSALDNSGGTILANGGTILLRGHAINGGTLATNSGGAIEVLNGQVIGGSVPVTLAAGANILFSTSQALGGPVVNHTTLTLAGNSSTNTIATLAIQGLATLSGGGALLLSDGAGAGAAFSQTVSGGTLDNLDNLITGTGIFSAGLALTNEAAGTIRASGGTLVLAATLTNHGTLTASTGATLDLTGTLIDTGDRLLVDGGTLLLDGGRIAGGTIAVANTPTLLALGGTLDGSAEPVTLAAGAILTMPAGSPAPASAHLVLSGTIANQGTIAVLADAARQGESHGMQVNGTATLTGGGTVTFADASASGATATVFIGALNGTDTLDNQNNTLMGAGVLGANGLTIINESGGNIIAAGGTLAVVTTVRNLGAFTASSGATVDLTGALVNSAAADLIDGATLLLDGGRIAGGTLEAAHGATLLDLGGTLDGSAEPLTLSAGGLLGMPSGTPAAAVASLTLLGTIANQGTIAITADATRAGESHALLASGTVVLAGGGTISLTDISATGNAATVRVTSASGGTATLDNVDNHILAQGRFGAGALVLHNETAGLIAAAGGTLVVQTTGGTSDINQGTLAALGGTLDLPGTVTNFGGTIGAWDDALHHPGVVLLDGLTVKGGTLASDTMDLASRLIDSAAGVVLDGTTASVVVAAGGQVAINPATTLSLHGGLLDQGTITATGTIGQTVTVLVGGTATLRGTGTIALADASASGFRYSQVMAGTSAADTLDNGAVISGVGLLGNRTTTLVNSTGGTVSANGGTLLVDTATVAIANTGLLTAASTGTLDLRSTIRNAGGTIAATGSGVTVLDNIVVTGGTFGGAGGGLVLGSYATIDGSAAPVTILQGGSLGVRYTDFAGSLVLTGTFANHGTMFVTDDQPSVYAGQSLAVQGTVTLSGGGQVLLQDDTASPGFSNSYVIGVGGPNYTYASNTLDNLDNTISGSGRLGNPDLVVINEAAGTISATGTLSVLTASGNSIPTLGSIVNRGTMQALGGYLYLQGVIDNRGGSIASRAAGGRAGTIGFGGVSISGGTLAADPGSIITANYGAGTLDGTQAAVTLTAGLDLIATDNGAITFTGGIVNHGSIISQPDINGYSGTFLVSGTAAFSGGGTITLENRFNSSIYASGFTGSDRLDNVDNLIVGQGDIGGGHTSVLNEAQGRIIAQGGTLMFDPSGTGTTVANRGQIGGIGGTVDIRSTTLDNAGGTLIARGDGLGHSGMVLLTASSISGGTLSGDSADPGSYFVNNGGYSTLDGSAAPVTLDSFARLQINPGTVFAKGTVIDQGQIALVASSAYYYSAAALQVQGDTVMTGGGTISLTDQLGNPGAIYTQAIIGASASDTLDNEGVTIIGVGKIGGATMTLVNGSGGVILAEGGTLVLSALGTPRNLGQIGALPGGTVDLTSLIVNTGGTLGGEGGLILLDYKGVVRGGTLAGQVDSYAGSIDGSSQVTIAAGATVGVLTQVPNSYAKTLTMSGSVFNLGTILVQGSSSGVGIYDQLVVAGGATLSGGGTLQLTGAGTADTGAYTQVVAAATGATLDNADNLITGFGSLGLGGLTVLNEAAGIIRAQGGLLDLHGPVTGNGLLEIASAATLEVDATVGSALTIGFRTDGTHEALLITAPSTTPISVANFAAGDTITLSGNHGTITQSVTGGTVTLLGNGTAFAAIAFSGNQAANFITATNSGNSVTLTTSVACFAEGTRILTTAGEVAVELLHPGMLLPTLDAGLQPVTWIGQRLLHPPRHADPRALWPIRVAPGAIADGVPARPLRLSPDHAVFIDGALIPIHLLVNGRTIVREPCARIRYFHVELPRHAVIIADGAAAESYLETGNRDSFENSDTVALEPRFARSAWDERACAPLLEGGRVLATIRARLRSRAGTTANDPAMRLLIDGKPVHPVIDGSQAHFQLPSGARWGQLVSRTHVPAEMACDSADHRRLGVAVARLALDGTPLAIAGWPGWHAPEPGHCWTTGDGAIPLAGARRLSVQLAFAVHYWSDADPGAGRSIA